MSLGRTPNLEIHNQSAKSSLYAGRKIVKSLFSICRPDDVETSIRWHDQLGPQKRGFDVEQFPPLFDGKVLSDDSDEEELTKAMKEMAAGMPEEAVRLIPIPPRADVRKRSERSRELPFPCGLFVGLNCAWAMELFRVPTLAVTAAISLLIYFMHHKRTALPEKAQRRSQRSQPRRTSQPGVVESIWTCPGTSQAMERQGSVECVAGKGIVGDRYNTDVTRGRYSNPPEPGRQMTLIAAEGMELLADKYHLKIGPQNCRRNVVVRGLHPLSELVGREFRLGDIRVFAHRASVPCMYLEGLTKQKGLFQEFYCDAGLNCEILEGGTLCDGASVELLPGEPDLDRCVVGRAWTLPALFVRPRERSAEERQQVLDLRKALEAEHVSATGTDKTSTLKKLRLFDQTHGRKNGAWDGGSPQY
ncbi:unnamed protein product [Symbiodinium sp. KB8]|nr:unnamed protein product [Symbiodinium sp. KB8]